MQLDQNNLAANSDATGHTGSCIQAPSGTLAKQQLCTCIELFRNFPPLYEYVMKLKTMVFFFFF